MLDTGEFQDIHFVTEVPSQTYVTATSYYNGLQPENEDVNVVMDTQTDFAQLVADFSSIPNLAFM